MQLNPMFLLARNLPTLVGLILLLSPSLSIFAGEQQDAAKLHQAVEANDLEGVKALLDNGVNVNARVPISRLDQTPLIIAVSNDSPEMVKLLLNYKADPLLEDENHDTAIVYATNSPQMMQLLRDRGYSIDTRNSEGETPLMRIAPYASAERLLSVLKAGADPHQVGSERETLLMACNDDGRVEVVRDLLQRGVNVNAQDAKGDTALMKAAGKSQSEEGSEQVVALLLDAKADLEIKDAEGNTVFSWMVRSTDPTVALSLLERGAQPDVRDNEGVTPLMKTHDGKLAEKLIELGASVQDASNIGHTALHFIAGEAPGYWMEAEEQAKLFERVKARIALLLKHGAKIDARDSEGRTPLHIAVRRDAVVTIDHLLRAGADIEAKDNTGRSALGLALADKNVPMLKLLLEKGANPDFLKDFVAASTAARMGNVDLLKLLLDHKAATTAEERGQLLLAALSGYQKHYNPSGRLACIRLLMENPIDVTQRDPQGMTALMWAAASNLPEVARAILNKGGEVSAKDLTGRDALSWAAAAGAKKTIPVLLSHGARLDSTDSQGQTALDWAELCQQEQVLPLLQP